MFAIVLFFYQLILTCSRKVRSLPLPALLKKTTDTSITFVKSFMAPSMVYMVI